MMLDIMSVLRDLGDLNKEEFKNCLLKNINMNFYYVLDLEKKEDSVEVYIRKREGLNKEIPKRIRLYDQSSRNKLGCSLSTYSINNTENLLDILLNVIETFNLNHIFDDYDLSKLNYINQKEEFEEKYKLPFRGYFTLALEGKLLIDMIENYDEIMINELYKKETYEGYSSCIYCNSNINLVNGSVKEPGIKIVSVTRRNELNENEIYVRCMECESLVMKGFNLLNKLGIDGKRFGKETKSVMLPLLKDERLWSEILKVREEVNSDLLYYEKLERIFSRYERRGLLNILEIVIQRIMNNNKIIEVNLYSLTDLKRLRNKKKFEKMIENEGFKRVDTDFPYYPKELIENRDLPEEVKWNLIMNVKNYWLGKYDKKVWDLIGKVLKIDKKQIELYKLYEDYLLLDESDLIKIIKEDNYYILGRLLQELISIEKRLGKKDLDLNKLYNRFEIRNKNYEYIESEIIKRINYFKSSNYLLSEELSLLDDLLLELNFGYGYLNERNYLIGRRSVLEKNRE